MQLIGIALLLALALVLPPAQAAAQDATSVNITAPTMGEVLRGTVTILGSAEAPNFAGADLSFSYSEDQTDTWFLIQAVDQPVNADQLGTWDTTSVSDGVYALRLRVNTLDGNHQDALVKVQIRNYTSPSLAQPTATATQSASVEIPVPVVLIPSPVPSPALPETPTALPPNPAVVLPDELYKGFARGAVIAVLVLIVLGLVLLQRRD